MARLSKLRLNKGDRVILSEGGEERSGHVERGNPNRILATGEFGQMTLTLNPREDDVTLRIEVKKHDAEGRELLTDG